MKNFLREAANWSSEALETACGWALYVAVAYAVLFADVTGRGALWTNLRSMVKEGRPAPAVAAHDGVRVIKLGAPAEKRDDGVQLVEFDYLKKSESGQETALVAVNDSPRVAELTDAPADVTDGGTKDWKRSLKGELRAVTVYGNGTQTTSASAQTVSARASADSSPAAVSAASTPQSAYRQGAAAASRPAIASRARTLGQNGADGVRNFAGK